MANILLCIHDTSCEIQMMQNKGIGIKLTKEAKQMLEMFVIFDVEINLHCEVHISQ